MTAVVEDAHLDIVSPCRFGDAAVIFQQGLFGKRYPVGFGFRIEPCFVHISDTPFATALDLPDDVQKDAGGFRKHLSSFTDAIGEVIKIWRIQAHFMEAGVERTDRPARITAVGSDFAPLRVTF